MDESSRSSISELEIVRIAGILVSRDKNDTSTKPGTSDSSESSQITLSSILQKQLANDSWVQCDNQRCKKWRRVDEDELENIGEDDQWLCRMNLDLEHNSCSDAEENYQLYDKLIKTVGLYYVTSPLPEGSLVWAKMHGYCKWPALISKDPLTGFSVDVDERNCPTSYHVEYLGHTRSHGWLPLKALSEYQDTAKNEKQEKKLEHRKHKLKYGCKTNYKRKFYRNQSVDIAIEEANSLLCDSPEKRLRVIEYAYKATVKAEVDTESKVSMQMAEGTLVCAKMPGYSKWPAMITPDPITGYSVDDVNPLSYHVEFLGKPHSHGWVDLKWINIYKDRSSMNDSSHMIKKGQRARYQWKRSWKTREQFAVTEADHLMALSATDRLKARVFSYHKADDSSGDVELPLLTDSGYDDQCPLLTDGSLVWAKMTGYCPWPAMVALDPVRGYSIEVDLHQVPSAYHLEYFGDPHSHGWLPADCVMPYEEGRNGYVGDGKLPLCVKNSRGKCDFMDVSVTEAIEEAERLLLVSDDKRLKVRKFTCTERHRARAQERLLKRESDKNKDAQVGESKKRSKVEVDKEVPQKIQSGPGLSGRATKPKRIPATAQTGSAVRNKPMTKHDLDCPMAMTSPMVAASRYFKAHNSQTEPVLSPRMVNASDLTFNTSLLNKSKEEKFTMDIQMYKQNGQAFLHDVYRFMNRHGLVFRGTPCWHNTAVIVFDLFLSIHERGGYQKVCQKHQWNNVYYELIQHTDKWGGAITKKYYYRYLYAYEVYIERGNYRDVVEIMKQESINKGPKKSKQKAAERSLPVDEKVIMIGTEDDIDFSSILSDIEHTNSKEEHVIDVTFFDESTPEVKSQDILSANTASEFGIANKPESAAQQVPSFDCSSEDSSGQGEAILHEMQTIQDEMDAMTEEMSAR